MRDESGEPPGNGPNGTSEGESSPRAQEASRCVAPPKSKIPRTDDGLLDTETLSRDWYSGDRPRRAEDLSGSERSYVLLAPGGAGKTTLIEDLKRREPASTAVDLRMHSQESLTGLIRTVSRNGSAVFIDAIDEALQLDSNVGYVLVSLLSEPQAREVSWRLACRPGSWSLDLADGLRAALPGFEELELLPLDLRGVEEIAGADADAFIAAVRAARLTRLLAQPLNARALLDQWRMTGALPASRSESMRHTISVLLAEAGGFRSLRVQDDRRIGLIAERLAAMTMFCGVGRVSLGRVDRRAVTSDDGAALPVTAVPTDSEPDLSGTPMSVGDLREVLGTSLFSAAGHGTVAFIHQSFAEFLAAAYLARRGVSGRRLLSLLGADVNGLTPGPMIEVLGWLLSLAGMIPADLVADNAKQLLSTAGLELADDQIRERIVEALLRGAATGSIDEGWGLDTSSLAHPGLGSQLHQASQRATNRWEIFWICRITRHCLVREMADDLLAIAFEPGWPSFMGAEAVRSFAAVAAPARLGELAPLLELYPAEDPQDEILAAALRAVLPDAVAWDRIAAALRPRRTRNFHGGYSQLLGELPWLISAEHVLPALRDALNRRPDRADYAFDRLLGGLLARAWAMKDRAVAAEVGSLLGQERLSRQEAFRREHLPWQLDDNPELRRTIAAAAMAVDGKAFFAVLDMQMLTPQDLTWLIDWIPSAPPEAREAAEVILRQLAWHVADADTADRIMTLSEDHPAYAVLSGFQESRDLGTRPDWVRRRIEDEDRPSPEQHLAVLEQALGRADDEVGRWWEAVVALAGDWNAAGHDVQFGWDLTKRPLWPLLEPGEQEEFWRLGLAYLTTRRPEPSRWAGRDSWTLHDVMPDWAAVYLLATLAAHRLDLLAQIRQPVWESWAKIIVAMPEFMSEDEWQQRIRESAPPHGRAALDAALREHVQTATTASFAHHPLADFSDTRLLDVVTTLARDTNQTRGRREAAIGVLVKHAPDVALEVARAAKDDGPVPAAAFDAIAKLAPEELLAPWFATGRSGPLEHLREIDPERLSDASLAALTRLLLDDLPFADDPERSDDVTESTPESAARRLRRHLLQSMAGRGMASHLAALSADRPAEDQEQIRHLLQQARAHETLSRWRPLEPQTMMELLSRGDARLVRDGAGLATVLLEQLGQIQHDVRERAGFRSLWNGEPGAQDASPKVEDDISDWLSHQLELRLTPHIVIDREIQVNRRRPRGVGTRIDITATSGGVQLGRVVFEAKHVQNSSLLTAIGDQLVGQYMQPAGLAHGIYIVYWVAPALRPPSWKRNHRDPALLAGKLREQARLHLPDREIEVFILDIGPPA
jgi:hypothetical protein